MLPLLVNPNHDVPKYKRLHSYDIIGFNGGIRSIRVRGRANSAMAVHQNVLFLTARSVADINMCTDCSALACKVVAVAQLERDKVSVLFKWLPCKHM